MKLLALPILSPCPMIWFLLKTALRVVELPENLKYILNIHFVCHLKIAD